MIKTNRGVSPVIGTVLLLAITVTIAGLLQFALFDFIRNFDEQTDTVNADWEYDSGNDNLIILDMGNADELRVEYSDSTTADVFTETGYYNLNGEGKDYELYGSTDELTELIGVFSE